MQNQNFLLSNYQLSASGTTYFTPEVEVDTDDQIIMFDVSIETLTGAPSAASLAAKFQLSPIEYDGLNMNTDSTSGRQRPWYDVVAADGYTGHLLIDGAWPTDLAASFSAYRTVSRRLLVPPTNRIVRLALTPTFTGGTAPEFRVTVSCGMRD